MNFLITISLIFIFSTLFVCDMSSAASLVDRKSPLSRKCLNCENTPDCYQEPPTECTWGEKLDHCGRRICARGPGERCDPDDLLKIFKNKFTLYGSCGDGMWCSKDDSGIAVCRGCFAESLECYPRYYTN